MGSPLAGVDADVYASASTTVHVTNELMTDSGDQTTYTAATHLFWSSQLPLTLEYSADGNPPWNAIDASLYTFQYAGGNVVFAVARTPGVNDHIRIALGDYLALTQLDDANTWALSLKADTADTTPFQAPGGYRRKKATVKDGSCKIGSFRTDDRMAAELGNLIALQLYVDKSANIRWEALGWIAASEPKAEATGVIVEDVSIELEGPAYFRPA